MTARRSDAGCARFQGVPVGVGVPCPRSKVVGRVVALRGGREVEVLGCVVPPARPKASPRSRCLPDFSVRDLASGVVLQARGSTVKERLRERSLLCNLTQPFPRGSGFGREIARAGYRGAELPYPHRRDGSPCCAHHFLYPDGLRSKVSDVRNGIGFVEAPELIADVASAVVKARKALGPLDAPRTLSDVERIADQVANHCGALVERWDGLGTKRYRSTATDSRATAAALRRKGTGEDEVREELAFLAGKPRRRKR